MRQQRRACSQERFQHAAMRGTGSMSRAAVPMDDESVARGVVAALCRCATECVDLSAPKVLHTPLSTVTSSAEGAATPPDGGSSSGAAGGGGGSAAGGGGGRKRRPKFMKRAELRKALGTYSDELIPAVRSAPSCRQVCSLCSLCSRRSSFTFFTCAAPSAPTRTSASDLRPGGHRAGTPPAGRGAFGRLRNRKAAVARAAFAAGAVASGRLARRPAGGLACAAGARRAVAGGTAAAALAHPHHLAERAGPTASAQQ